MIVIYERKKIMPAIVCCNIISSFVIDFNNTFTPQQDLITLLPLFKFSTPFLFFFHASFYIIINGFLTLLSIGLTGWLVAAESV